jgi:hypothetical protein
VLLVVIVAGLIMPLFQPAQTTSAAQITSRSVAIGTSKASATSTYTYTFTLATAGNVGSLAFQACTTPLGTCTSPGGTVNINAGTTTIGAGWAAGAFTRNNAAAATLCTSAVNMLCTARSSPVSETAASKVMTVTSQVNPTAVGSYYIRITTFSDIAWVTAVDSGVVAFTVNSQLTINARIQELLTFCVGTTAVDDAITSPGADCSAISGNTVDIGILDPAVINITPVSTNGGTNTNGVAMVRTNVTVGVVVSYFSELNTSSGTFKVAGATCGTTSISAGSRIDQCINDNATQTVFAASTEAFGMTIAGTNCASTSAYSCAYASNTNNLKPTGQYIGAALNAYGTTNGFAWDDTGATQPIATSAGSTIKAVDDEALILKFAATPSITTPQGAYTVTATYIATATF